MYLKQVLKMKILIGSTNNWKIKDWQEKLSDFEVISPLTLGISLDVEEGITSLEENAIKKAKVFSQVTNLLTLSEDTGFFIESLNGEPGVALKRWGGELPENVSDEQFINHLKKKVSPFHNPKGYFKTVIALVSPAGVEKTISIIIPGYLDTNLLNSLTKVEGFSLSDIFINQKTGKTWNTMDLKEQNELYRPLYTSVKEAILNYYNNSHKTF